MFASQVGGFAKTGSRQNRFIAICPTPILVGNSTRITKIGEAEKHKKRPPASLAGGRFFVAMILLYDAVDDDVQSFSARLDGRAQALHIAGLRHRCAGF